MSKKNWQVYIILCKDGSLYTGITTDGHRPFSEHDSWKGAKYFRGHTPQEVVYVESDHDRSSASRRESEIKGMRVESKWKLIKVTS